MKSRLLIILISMLFCFISHNGFSQKKNIKISLSKLKYSSKLNFYIDTVIDKRITKEALGFTYKRQGAVPVVFKEGFCKEMNQFFKLSFPKSDSLVPIIVHIKELYTKVIFEKKKVNYPFHYYPGKNNIAIAIAEIELEFLREMDGKLYSYGVFSKVVQSDVLLKHSKAQKRTIKHGIKYCIAKFRKSKWIKSTPKLYNEKSTRKEQFNFLSCPKKGRYKTFYDLVSNNPDTSKILYLELDSRLPKLNRYILYKDSVGRKIDKEIIAVSDGRDLYITKKYSEYNVKVLELGRYLYFEDRFLFTKEPYIFDTKTGISNQLTNKMYLKILYNYPELKKKYSNLLGGYQQIIKKINEIERLKIKT